MTKQMGDTEGKASEEGKKPIKRFEAADIAQILQVNHTRVIKSLDNVKARLESIAKEREQLQQIQIGLQAQAELLQELNKQVISAAVEAVPKEPV